MRALGNRSRKRCVIQSIPRAVLYEHLAGLIEFGRHRDHVVIDMVPFYGQQFWRDGRGFVRERIQNFPSMLDIGPGQKGKLPYSVDMKRSSAVQELFAIFESFSSQDFADVSICVLYCPQMLLDEIDLFLVGISLQHIFAKLLDTLSSISEFRYLGVQRALQPQTVAPEGELDQLSMSVLLAEVRFFHHRYCPGRGCNSCQASNQCLVIEDELTPRVRRPSDVRRQNERSSHSHGHCSEPRLPVSREDHPESNQCDAEACQLKVEEVFAGYA